ncbi:hypothetical protein [Paenarthrobacter ilicis]|uniref:hypothetical protein n=1 Tax=Paenarthrobacter ilicis TaxID=43665 RepID=UPI0028D839ED|nr:hypothetical protein [Paenarthrobacter ilicis]
MLTDTDSLLLGPRGRRLCLELAMEADADVRRAILELGFDLEPSYSKSRVVRYSLGSVPLEPVPTSMLSVAEVANIIAMLDLSLIDDDLVQRALPQAVDAARYWQQPDGVAVLADTPEVRVSSARIAEKVLQMPAAQWWLQDFQPDQWAIDWRVPGDPTPLPRNPRQTLADWARKERSEELRAVRERPQDPHANYGGEWWSIAHGLVQTVPQIPEGLSLVEDSLGWEFATTIPVSGTGRILEIRSAEEWTDLCRAFPLEVTASRRHDWFRTTGRHGRWVIPDWEQASAQWDAVHLTVIGYLSAAGRALSVDGDTASVIAGWDPGSTIWLRDVARENEEPRQFWRSNQEDRWDLVGTG